MRSRVLCKFRILSVCMIVVAASLAGRPASADVISLGTLSFEPHEIGQSNAFWILNLTGDLADDDHPVTIPLTFLNASLHLIYDGGDTKVFLPPVGPGYLTDPDPTNPFAPWPELKFDASIAFVSARLEATLSAPSFSLLGGDTFLPTSLDIIAELSAAPGLPLEPFAATSIDIVGDRIPALVPEPGTLSLLLLGGLFGASRVRAATRSSRPGQ